MKHKYKLDIYRQHLLMLINDLWQYIHMKSVCTKTDTFLVKQINDVLHVMIRQILSRMLPCIFIAMWLYRDNGMHPALSRGCAALRWV